MSAELEKSETRRVEESTDSPIASEAHYTAGSEAQMDPLRSTERVSAHVGCEHPVSHRRSYVRNSPEESSANAAFCGQ